LTLFECSGGCVYFNHAQGYLKTHPVQLCYVPSDDGDHLSWASRVKHLLWTRLHPACRCPICWVR
jgi:hypothetical protein